MMNRPRKPLADVLNSTDMAKIARLFNEAEAATEMLPLPRGEYRCRITHGEFDKSKSGTPGYVLTFTVDDGEHRGRRFWHTLWLTPAALPMAKRDLRKLGVTSLEMLDRPLPPGFVCDVKVAVRIDDDGHERNRVVSFQVVSVLDDPTADPDFPSPPPGNAKGGAT